MRVLITGGAGFIGSHIAEHFQGTAEVRVLDNLRTGYLRNLEGLRVEFLQGSITNRDAVRRAVQGVDYIFHLAAMVSVPESMAKPRECVELNALGFLNVLEEAAEAGVKKLVLSSSAAVYGDNPTVPKRESMTPEPMSPYAVTKLDGEYYCAMFQRAGHLRTASARYFNVFGPRQDPKSPYAAAIAIFVHRALRNEPIVIHGDGEQTRDFVFVKDIVAANVHLAMTDDLCGVYNVAYGGRITVRDLAERIIRLTGSKSEIRHEAERAGDVKHSSADPSKLMGTGFVPVSNFDAGLAATIEYFRAAALH